LVNKFSISRAVLIIFSLTLLWNYRLYINPTGVVGAASSYIPALQISLIAMLFTLNFNFVFKKDFDSCLVLTFTTYILVNCIFFSIFNDNLVVSSLKSALISILILVPFFIGRHLGNLVNFRFIVWVIFIGASIFLLYELSLYFLSGRYELDGISGRTMKQRLPLIINFILMLSLILSSKSILVNIYTKVIFAASLFFLVMSFSKGAYILLVINLIFLMKFMNFGKFTLISIIVFLMAVFFARFSRETGIFLELVNFIFYRFSQLESMILDYKSFGSSYERLSIWKAIYEHMIINTPRFFFGHGEAGPHIANLYITVPVIKPIMTSESQYISTFFRGGLVGLIMQTLILFRVTFLAYKLKFLDKENSDIFLALFIFLMGLIVFLGINPSLRDREFGMLFYYLYGLMALRIHKIF